MTTFRDLTGLRSGRLVAIERAPNIGRRVAWLCVCDCGRTKVVESHRVTAQSVQSCGCMLNEARRTASLTHGLSDKPECYVWHGMMARCYKAAHQSYRRYGGRGIYVCDRWKNSFENFYADMGPRPSSGHSLDRIDNNGPYSPENCRWATVQEQALNKEVNVFIEYQGRVQCMTHWSRELGIHQRTLSDRMARGMTFAEAVAKGRRRPVAMVGRECEHCGKPFGALKAECARGGGRFCSKSCSTTARNLARTALKEES